VCTVLVNKIMERKTWVICAENEGVSEKERKINDGNKQEKPGKSNLRKLKLASLDTKRLA
jgi:hypothetical protein